MNNECLTPPLRVIINSECNGKCRFCHKEGNSNYGDMSMDMIDECAKAVNHLGISRIALTGGEPTKREDLSFIIDHIQKNKEINIGLTTNGYKLENLMNSLSKPIDNVNLSVISFNKNIAMQYQAVDPNRALAVFEQFPSNNKNLNVFVLKENYLEINDFIKWCVKKTVSLDLIFDAKADMEYQRMQKKVLNELININAGEIILKATPVLKIDLNDHCALRVKTPYLSGLLYNEICESCEEVCTCFERMCAVRVYPNGSVSPCLSGRVCIQGETVYDRIINTYNNLKKLTLRKDFFQG